MPNRTAWKSVFTFKPGYFWKFLCLLYWLFYFLVLTDLVKTNGQFNISYATDLKLKKNTKTSSFSISQLLSMETTLYSKKSSL